MQEVLLDAIKSAQSIIESKLNGVSFCQEYVALGHLIQTIEDNKDSVELLRRDAIKVILTTSLFIHVVRSPSLLSQCVHTIHF